MKTFFLPLLFLALTLTAYAQRPDASQVLHEQANTPAAQQKLRAALHQAPQAFLGEGHFEPGYLHLLSGRRVLVVGLRYHLGQHVVEVQDSMQTDSTSFWPLAALRGFDLGTDDDEPNTIRRFRARLVHDGAYGVRLEAVQMLTTTDAGPLLLAYLPGLSASKPSQVLLAGPGREINIPLRPLVANEESVLRLVGERARVVKAYVQTYNLNYNIPADVAKMLNYYNQQATVSKK